MLDHDTCRRAVATRDARFDGWFVTAVRAAGVYCRPSCPDPPADARGVEFLPTGAAAQAGGYRACPRCLPDAGAASGTVVLRLAHRTPFDPHGLLAFLAARAVDGVESVGGDGYRRTLRLPHGPASVHLDLTALDGAVGATLRLTDPRDLGPAVARLRRLLDSDADPEAVDAVLGADPALAPSVAAVPGLRLAGSVDGAETAVRTVLGQQVSVAAARTAAARLTAVLGEPVPPELCPGDGDPHLLFPDAATVAARGLEVLTGPARRIATVVGLCERIASGDLVLAPGRDPGELRAELAALPGLGPWSAGYLAMRVLGDPDELLASDLAVRRGAEALGLPGDAAALEARAARWAPWRSYAATHLWRAAAGAPTLTRRRTA